MPFEEGQSGNPAGGVEKYKTWKWFIRKYGEMTMQEIEAIDITKLPAKEAAVVKRYKKVLTQDDLRSEEFLANREEGTPKQTIENTGTQTNVLTFEKVAAAGGKRPD
jgi:hypothetical protein